MKVPEIEKVMKILEDYFNYKERTTLNRMRKDKNPDAFRILISCLLSLRARDENTEKVSQKLFEIADTPKKISKIPIKKLGREGGAKPRDFVPMPRGYSYGQDKQ